MGKKKLEDKNHSTRIKINHRSRTLATKQRIKQSKRTLEKLKEKVIAEITDAEKWTISPNTPLLTSDMTNAMHADFIAEQVNQIRTNVVTNMGIINAVMDRSVLHKLNNSYSHEMERVPLPTTQEHSGRCWIFAALNIMRVPMVTTYRLPDTFEFSEAYLFFWDKIERSYCCLTELARMRHDDMNSHLYHYIVSSTEPSNDGGNWGQFVNLINKYGMVPKTVYGETFNSSYSDEMNDLLNAKISVLHHWIRDNANLSDEAMTEAIIKDMMPDIYALVSSCLGNPPMSNQTFVWEYNESGNNPESVRQKGTYRSIDNLTPQVFYEDYVRPVYNLDNKVFISNDPLLAFGKTYTVEHGGCMVGGMPDIVLNVDIEEMRNAVAESIMEHKPVWFACDVEKCFDPYISLLSTKAFKMDQFFDQDLSVSKAQGLAILNSYPKHAMSFVGLNLIGDDHRPYQIDKWKVENSWSGRGYLQMDDEWFKKYVFTAVVDVKYLSNKMQDAYAKYKYKPVVLPFTDPFHAIASMPA
jgi:bleomycin hydrolase